MVTAVHSHHGFLCNCVGVGGIDNSARAFFAARALPVLSLMSADISAIACRWALAANHLRCSLWLLSFCLLLPVGVCNVPASRSSWAAAGTLDLQGRHRRRRRRGNIPGGGGAAVRVEPPARVGGCWVVQPSRRARNADTAHATVVVQSAARRQDRVLWRRAAANDERAVGCSGVHSRRRRAAPGACTDAVYDMLYLYVRVACASYICTSLTLCIWCAPALCGRMLTPAPTQDIKSANVMLTADNSVKLIDFGFAKTREQSIQQSSAVSTGTYAWMAPEKMTQEPGA